jgi:hypothetical protein
MIGGTTLFLSLFSNLAIFIVLTAVYGFVNSRMEKNAFPARPIVTGIIFGFFAFVCMHARIPVHPGVIVDQRNAIVALSGAFGGPLSGLDKRHTGGSYRAHLGAPASSPFCGVALSPWPDHLLSAETQDQHHTLGICSVSDSHHHLIAGFLFMEISITIRTHEGQTVPYGSPSHRNFFTGLLLYTRRAIS